VSRTSVASFSSPHPNTNQIWLMMSIGHTMSSCPRTSGGNLLTPKNG
jgi:hypothetical protein